VLHWLEALSLTQGPLHVLLLGGLVVGLGGLLAVRRDRRWWLVAVPAAVAAAVVPAVGFREWVVDAKPWPDGLPLEIVAWIAAGLLGPTVLVAGWAGRRWRIRMLGCAAALLTLLGAADAVDTFYGAFPTVATALQLPPADATSATTVLDRSQSPTGRTAPASGPLWSRWTPPPDMPLHGAVTQVRIPAPRSGFPARAAWLYLPPAYLTAHRPLLPVLVMLSGEPGSPRDWLDGGLLAQQLDRWTAAHHGLGPVVVMPDSLGALTANPLCMDSSLGRADTYLARDVPAWITSALQVDPDTAHWAVGGLSAGGTCALQLAVAHPALFPTFLDESGQREPTLGGHARTIAATFGGNEAAFDAVDPLHELARHRYPASAGVVMVGAQDSDYRPQAREVTAAARAAGMSITYLELPGTHNWPLWRTAFGRALPLLAARMGVAP
jgi:S-formylglutathione hydrolase FrmB